MKYIALVYQHPEGLEAISDAELDGITSRCGEWVRELEDGGRHIHSAGLQSTSTSVTVRTRNGKQTVTDGPFAETKECLGGFTLFEAKDLNDAIRIVEQFPPAEFGTVEIRPLMDPELDLIDPLDRRIAASIRRSYGMAVK